MNDTTKEYWKNKVSGAVLELWSLLADDGTDCKVVIETSARQADRLMSVIEGCQGTIHRELGIVPSISAALPSAAIPALARRFETAKIWLDTPVYAMPDRVVPDSEGDSAYDTGYTGKGVVIAVLDTGIFPHEDFIRPENRILAWHDLIGGRRQPYDDHGHGTHVAGIIAGNGLGSDGACRGMAPEARLVGVKILGEDASGRLSDLLAGIEWCLTNQATLNIKIINLSLGTPAQGDSRRDPLCRAVSKAVRNGVAVCASAGNDLDLNHPVDSPGISPDIIVVGNSQNEKTLSSDDFFGRLRTGGLLNRVIPDLVAPGRSVASLDAKGGYCSLSGVSVAAPIVSGAAALMIQKRPDIGPDRIKRFLKTTAKDLGVGINLQGAGEINIGKLFGSPRRKPKPEITKNSLNPDLLKTIIGLVGQNMAAGDRGNSDMVTNMIMSILKGL